MSAHPARGTAAWRWVAAALVLLATALIVVRDVLPDPVRLLPWPARLAEHTVPGLDRLDHFDQQMVVATVARNARLILADPFSLRDADGPCFPMPRAWTLGEHMLGLGLLAAPAWALGAEPILAFNTALVLALWIAGLAMLALIGHFTGSVVAALIAALAFLLVPDRLADPTHPFVHGDLWAPLVLLFLHRCVVRARLREALGLAAVSVLTLGESLYPVLATLLLGGVYALFLLPQRRRGIAGTFALLALAALPVVATAGWLYGPYLETAASWPILSRRASLLLDPATLRPGAEGFPGPIVLTLALVALGDRLRGPRPCGDGTDPRLAWVVGGLLCLWCALRTLVVPGTGWALPSPLVALAPFVPGLAAVRGLANLRQGFDLALATLAGFGTLALLEFFQGRTRHLVAAGTALALLACALSSTLARPIWGRTLRLRAWDARPPDAEIALWRALPEGPIVDLPLPVHEPRAQRLDVAEHLLLAAWARNPLAGCYNSFSSPVVEQVETLANELPAAPAAQALRALGFRSVALRRDLVAATPGVDLAARWSDAAVRAGGLTSLGQAGRVETWALGPAPAQTSEVATLAAPGAPGSNGRKRLLPGSSRRIPIEFMVDAKETWSRLFVHPALAGRAAPPGTGALPSAGRDTARGDLARPLAPQAVRLVWRAPDGRIVLAEETRALLPLAVAPGGRLRTWLDARVPFADGPHDVDLLTHDGSRPLGRAFVDILPYEKAFGPTGTLVLLDATFIADEILSRGAPPLPRSGASLPLVQTPAGTAKLAQEPGPLELHWITGKGELAGSVPLSDPPQFEAGPEQVVVRALPPPLAAGVYLVALVEKARPSVMLAGAGVTLAAPPGPGSPPPVAATGSPSPPTRALAPASPPPLDLLVAAGDGRIALPPESELAIRGAHGEARAVLATTAGSEIRLPSLEMPAGAWLDTGFAASSMVFLSELPGLAEPLEVEIAFVPDDAGDETLLLRRRIDLRGQESDRRWWDERLDLSALAGRRGRIVLRSRNLGAPAPEHPVALLWSATRLRLAETRPSAPNLLLVTIDCLRADHVGSYGYERDTTPVIDALARDGIRFAAAHANAPMTLPSIPQLFTSRLLPGPRDPTLTEPIARQGIASAAIVNNAWIPLWLASDLHGKPPRTFDRLLSGTLDARQITDAALRWLDAHERDRFALYLHYLDAHTPYAPPREWIDAFAEADYTGPVQVPFGDVEGADTGRYDARDRRRIVDLYDAAIRSIDAQLARLLDWLRVHQRFEETLIVITADHGEEFWEHGRFFHGQSLFEELLHVPLVVRLPGSDPALRNRVVERPVQTLDLAPSILDWLDLPSPAGFEGRPLAQVLANPALPADPWVATATQAQYPARFASRVGDLKLIESLDSATREVFDLSTDPTEKRAQPPDQSATAGPAAAAVLEQARAPLRERGVQARWVAAKPGRVALTLRSRPHSGSFVTLDRHPGAYPLHLSLSPDGATLSARAETGPDSPAGFRFDRTIDPSGKSPRDLVEVALEEAMTEPLVVELGDGASQLAAAPAPPRTATAGTIEVDLRDPRLETTQAPSCPAPLKGIKLCLWRGRGDTPLARPGIHDPEVRRRLEALGYVTN